MLRSLIMQQKPILSYAILLPKKTGGYATVIMSSDNLDLTIPDKLREDRIQEGTDLRLRLKAF